MAESLGLCGARMQEGAEGGKAAGALPGLVGAIRVAVSQEVKTGETAVLIEAMKMQNILKAERDGVVKAVSARAGDPVAADDVLVEFA